MAWTATLKFEHPGKKPMVGTRKFDNAADMWRQLLYSLGKEPPPEDVPMVMTVTVDNTGKEE